MATHSIYMGIDPGLVDTGIVCLDFIDRNDAVNSTIELVTATITRDPNETIAHLADRIIHRSIEWSLAAAIFIEKYEPRGNFGTNKEMVELVALLRTNIKNSKVISNAGSKKMLKPGLLKLYGLTEFTSTHHQDLQAAGRILLWGMLKDDKLNEFLAGITVSKLDYSNHWRVVK